MSNKLSKKDIARLLPLAALNPNRNGEKHPYHVIKEDIYEMGRRRKMKLDELMFAVYLRGKGCRFGNPFKLSNATLVQELGQSEWIIRKLRATLQLKGIIKYNEGTGKRWTEYSMLDTVMIHQNHKQSYPQGKVQG